MIRNLLSVGGFTLLSRVTGFLSLAMQSAIMGAGAVSDAFFIAQRLPNSFRAIFGEGAFNAAFVPSYSMAIEQKGDAAAEEFAGEVYTLLLASQIILLAIVWTLHAAIRLAARAGPRRPSGKIRAGRQSDAHHLSLSALHHALRLAHGRAERAWPFRASGLRAQSDEFFRDGGARRRLPFSKRRLCGELGHHHLRRAGARTADVAGAAHWRPAALAQAALVARARFLHSTRAGDHRLGQSADRRARRHNSLIDASRRRRVVDFLRGAAVPASRRRHRHCRRHCAAAGDEPPARRGR